MNPFGYHYPAGAESDPRAPWNQRDIEACDECGGEGKNDEGEKCDACNGTGEEGNQE